jgi:hypothetical protein
LFNAKRQCYVRLSFVLKYLQICQMACISTLKLKAL